jgi:hypothetical protein
MEPRLSFVTLGVADLERATRFYEAGLGLPRLDSPPTVSFFELGRTWLALYPRHLLAADAGVPAEDAARAGGRIVKPAQQADWGGYAGYFADPDGFLWEVAWNPRFPHV